MKKLTNTYADLRASTKKQITARRKNISKARKYRWDTKTDRQIDSEAHRIFWSGLTKILGYGAFVCMLYFIIPPIVQQIKQDTITYIKYDMPRFTLKEVYAVSIDAPQPTITPQQKPIAEAQGDPNVIQQLLKGSK